MELWSKPRARGHDQLPKLFPHTDARSWFNSSPAIAHETAFRNGSLQAGYLIIAARLLGLDAGPMLGFDAKMLDERHELEVEHADQPRCRRSGRTYAETAAARIRRGVQLRLGSRQPLPSLSLLKCGQRRLQNRVRWRAKLSGN